MIRGVRPGDISRRGFGLALVLIAETARAEPAPAFSKKPRPAQPRTAVPDEIQTLLPWKGLYAAGSGSAVPAWRVVVTIEGDLRAGSNPRPGSSPVSLLDRKRSKLTPVTLAEIVKMADKAWREKPPRTPPAASPLVDPTSDYAEVLIVADAEQVFYLAPGGPVTAPAAAALVDRLKREAAR